MPSIAEKRREFRRLHETGCFVLPNPWDIGSARYLQGLGFKAIASTSAGFAFTQGLPDGAVTRDMMLAHLRELSEAADIPLNADFEGGFADDPDGVAESVRLCCATGVSGLSIEDSTGNPDNPLYDFELSLARVKAARAAIDKAGADVLFTARSEGFIRNRPDLAETIRRLKAYAAAGADCLYAPGIKTREEIEAIVAAVAPKPVNFLMAGAMPFSVVDLEQPGRAPHQPWRNAGADRLDDDHPRRPRDRNRGHVHETRRRHHQCRAQRIFPRRHEKPPDQDLT